MIFAEIRALKKKIGCALVVMLCSFQSQAQVDSLTFLRFDSTLAKSDFLIIGSVLNNWHTEAEHSLYAVYVKEYYIVSHDSVFSDYSVKRGQSITIDIPLAVDTQPYLGCLKQPEAGRFMFLIRCVKDANSLGVLTLTNHENSVFGENTIPEFQERISNEYFIHHVTIGMDSRNRICLDSSLTVSRSECMEIAARNNFYRGNRTKWKVGAYPDYYSKQWVVQGRKRSRSGRGQIYMFSFMKIDACSGEVVYKKRRRAWVSKKPRPRPIDP